MRWAAGGIWSCPTRSTPTTCSFHTQRFSGARDFADYLIEAFDWLHREGAHEPKMMSIGLHLRMIGRPGRIAALDRILRHIPDQGGAWIARRMDIARHWLALYPPP